jgi:uncharacterized protein
MSTVVVLGASDDQGRVSYEAVKRLLKNHHIVIPVNLKGGEVAGLRILLSLKEISQPVDTVTMYISRRHQSAVMDDIIALRPRRVIFNPGSENRDIYPQFQAAGISIEEACTLVLLGTRQF